MKKMYLKYFSIVTLALLSSQMLAAQFRVVAYLPTWANFPNSINNVQLSKITHINVAFANPSNTGVIVLSDSKTTNQLATVVSTAHAQSVKVFLSIGGAGAPAANYKTLLSDPTKMNTFVSNLVSYCTNNTLDGIDVDIEGDVLNGSSVTKTQYQTFVTALATALHAKSFSMTAALATWFGSYVSNTAAAQFDWINVMSYDNALPTDPAAPHAPYSQTTSDFSYWNSTKGVLGSKLTIGLPFYGYGWGTFADANELSYSSIISNYAGAENNDQVGSGNNVIYYNGIPTIKQKTTFACNNASGVMIWQITEDATGSKSLINAISEAAAACTVSVVEIVKNKIVLFPNPCHQTCTLQINGELGSNSTIVVYDATGRSVMLISTSTLSGTANTLQINTDTLPAGLYFCSLTAEHERTFAPFIKN